MVCQCIPIWVIGGSFWVIGGVTSSFAVERYNQIGLMLILHISRADWIDKECRRQKCIESKAD